jgi:hypothetical protein
MRILLIALSLLVLSGCTVIPYKERNLDTTSNFKKPTEGMAGVYVYQWKSGIIGAGRDVDFEIKGQPIISLNTGEYGYFETPPGQYEYKFRGGLYTVYLPVEFEANHNYFFRAALINFSDRASLVPFQVEIDEVKENIMSGRYEWYNVD